MDNCAGQDKNKFVMWYLVYFLLTRDADCVEIGFLLKGYTRCLVDSNFGAFKKAYRANDISTIDQLVSTVVNSSKNNFAELTNQKWINWKDFVNINKLHAFKGILKYHVIMLKKQEDIIKLFSKNTPEDIWVEQKLITPKLQSLKKPSEIVADGISQQQ